MTATAAWDQLRDWIWPANRSHEESLRPVAVRLALQTVLLLLVMVIALEVSVYVVTQHALLQSLQTAVRQHPPPPDDLFRRGPSGFPAPNPGRRPSGNFGSGPRDHAGDVSVVWVDPSSQIVDGFGVLGRTLLDPAAVRAAFRAGHSDCCTEHAYQGETYLIFTDVVRANDGGIVGVGQASISERQYRSTLNTLAQTLVAVALLGLIASGIISAVLVRRSLEPVRRAMQRQRDFVADAAHELRTPLAIQRTVGEVGMSAGSEENPQATIEQMLVENQHLTRLVDDLSLLARADSLAVAIDRHRVDLSALIGDTTAELAPLADEQEVRLTADLAAGVHVTGDELRLRQLLLILLDNALKHTPSGGTVYVQLQAQHGRVRLQVTDSGPGIPPADLPRIFDRFYQSDQARSDAGTGLGLAIGRWITEAHGGQIVAGNVAPHGAVFTVNLPLARSPSAPRVVS